VLLGVSASVSAHLYHEALVVDTTAPLAPFTSIDSGVSPDRVVHTYASAGVTFAVFTVVDDAPNSIEQTLKLLGLNRRYFASRSDRYVLADRAEQVRAAKAQGQLAVAFAFQGSNALLGELALVEVYRRLGVVQMLLAYNAANLVADGCHEGRNAGLTDFGRQVILEMNRVGMIVDVSHVSVRSSLEAIELTSKPPIFSHSTPKHFAPHDRNITDEQIRACAQKEGLIGLTGIGLFMDSQTGRATTSRLADTIEYVVQLVGPRHAGIGLDHVINPEPMMRYLRANAALYGSGHQYPLDQPIHSASPAMLADLTEELCRRGFSDSHVRGILGENYLRVFEANTLEAA
jgi:membrane dipeptidase